MKSINLCHRGMGELTCHHECKREPFLHRLSMNLVGQGGKTHIFLVLVLREIQISKTVSHILAFLNLALKYTKALCMNSPRENHRDRSDTRGFEDVSWGWTAAPQTPERPAASAVWEGLLGNRQAGPGSGGAARRSWKDWEVSH